MTQLLVSVRDAEEAVIAVDAGADVIDIKEPRHGSLGAADAATIAAISRCIDGRVPLSMALGELRELASLDPEIFPPGIRWAKLGLAGCANRSNWQARWKQAIQALPPTTQPVAVVYADAELAGAPPIEPILALAERFRCAAVLVDTFDKSAGNLMTHWSIHQLAGFVAEVQSRGMLAVVAGGLTVELVPAILTTAPDLIAVRGAVCSGDRSGQLDGRKVASLRALIRSLQTLQTPSVQARKNQSGQITFA